MIDLNALQDGDAPIFSRNDMAEILSVIECRIQVSKSFAEGAEFRGGLGSTDTAFYSGAWTEGQVIQAEIEQRLFGVQLISQLDD